MSRQGFSTFIDTESRKNKPRLKSFRKDLNHTQSPRKKASPQINKSFACYNVSSKIFKNSENFTKERSRTMSIGNSTPSNRRVSSMRISALSTSGKFPNGHPGPQELEESKHVRLRKELLIENIERAKKELQSGCFESALAIVKKVLKDEPNNVKALYVKAQCFMGMKEFKLAIPDLLSIIQDHPAYNKGIYIDIATCFVESKDYTTAVRQITRGLLKFPKFVEGFISRGTLYNQMQKWDKAVSDFYEAISLAPTEGAGYLGLADSLLGMNEEKNAVKMLDQAVKCQSTLIPALLKRGKILFGAHEFEKALIDLQRLIDLERSNIEGHYYKAFCLLAQENLIDAAVCLEQVIKYDTLKQFTGAAIYNLGAIKIKQRDFYGAHFTFQRAVEQNLEIEEQKILKSYVEAILCLMRRKFKEGITCLTKIIKKKHSLLMEYMGNCYAYRGYAYASIESHEKAVKDLGYAKKVQDLDNASMYNLIVSQAVVLGKGENALELLTKAEEMFPKNIEPLAYKAAVYFQMAVDSHDTEIAGRSKELLDTAIKMRESDSDMYFYRGIVLYYCGKPIDAVYDFEQAIDKAEDNVAIHFLARGLCSARLRMYKEATQDFSIAIQLNEKMAEAYAFRGRCGYILEDSESALKDFKTALSLKPHDLKISLYLISAIILTNSFDDALEFIESFDFQDPLEQSLQRTKLFLMHSKIPQALQELERTQKLGKTLQNNFDIELLTIYSQINAENPSNYSKLLTQLTSILNYKSEGNICKNSHITCLKGIIYIEMNEMRKAREEFSSILPKKLKKDKRLNKMSIEALFNISLTYIIEKRYEEAMERLTEIANNLDDVDRGKTLLIIGVIKYALESNREAKNILTEAFKYDPETVGLFLEEQPGLLIYPLNSGSNFAENFKKFKVEIGDCHPFYIKPSITFPEPCLQGFDFNIESELLELFSVKTVKCKPETPWLNRVKGSIQFTDEIKHVESESVSEEVAEAHSDSDVFTEKSLRKIKSQEISIRTPVRKRKDEDSDSSLSEIMDDFDDLNF